MLDERSTAIEPTFDTILWPPGYLRAFFNNKAVKKSAKRFDPEVARLLRSIRTQEHYYNTVSAETLKSPAALPFYSEHRKDLNAVTAGVLALAASNMAKAIRIPAGTFNGIVDEMRSLSDCLRANSHHKQDKVNDLGARLGRKIAHFVPERVQNEIGTASYSIKIVSDAPLELLPVHGLPLGLRFETSKIPATPGNLTFAALLQRSNIVTPSSEFSDVVIIRSFGKKDRLSQNVAICNRNYESE